MGPGGAGKIPRIRALAGGQSILWNEACAPRPEARPVFFAAAARFFVCTIVVLALGFFLPGFAAGGFSGAIPAALGSAVVGYLVESAFGRRLKARTRAVVGFIVTGASVYMVQFLVPGMDVSVTGAAAAGALVGLVDRSIAVEVD